jgi:hypothetical protein
MRGRKWGAALLAAGIATLAQAAPTPPSRAGFGPGVGGVSFSGRHDGGGYTPSYDDCGDSDVADLDFRAWSLDRELAAEDNVMTVIRLRNNGPCPARKVQVAGGGLDQFSRFTFTCPDLASDDPLRDLCTFATLAPGETKYFVLTATVCAFVTGESRDTSTYAVLTADSIDPDTTGGPSPTYEFAYAFVHLIGPYDDDQCPTP